MTDAAGGTLVRLKTGVVWRELDGEVVALDLDSSGYLKVNRSGTRLWPLIAEGTTEAQLVGELVDRYELDPDRALADVTAFLVDLGAHALMESGR